ncbi:MAG: DMT family transporter [Pseudomonadota bacterium]
MDSIVFLTVIGAALLHAVWNALVKGGDDKLLSMGAVIVGHLPLAIIGLFIAPLPHIDSIPYLIGGIVLHFGYQLFLLESYRIGDLTQVYPIARGSAPVMVALFSVGVLGVVLSGIEILSIIIICIGILSLALTRHSDGAHNRQAAVLALGTGLFIASYSLVDGMGARLAGTSLGYYCWLSIFNGALMIGFLAIKSPMTLGELNTKGLPLLIIGGGASFLAYALVIWAFTQAPIALVTSLRETSIIFALLIGVFFLKERLDLFKAFSIFTTLIGAVLLRFGRL